MQEPDDLINIYFAVFNTVGDTQGLTAINRMKDTKDKDETFCQIIEELKLRRKEDREYIIHVLLDCFGSKLSPKIVQNVLAAIELI